MKIAFVVERPIQIVTANAIINQLDIADRSDILISRGFYGARGVAARIGASGCLPGVAAFDDYRSAIEHATSGKYQEVFFHWDVGFGTNKFLYRARIKNPNLTFSLFEEGIGTYRQDIYSGIKKALFRIYGLPINVGGSRFVSRIFVYNPKMYIEKATRRPGIVTKVETSIAEEIQSSWGLYSHIFDEQHFLDNLPASRGSYCRIYLPNWQFDERKARSFFLQNTINIIKLHPRCTDFLDIENALKAPPSIPAEMLISAAAMIYDRVFVLHSGSSTAVNTAHPNVTFEAAS
jgi:hypothetical protein